ncbi:ROK family protein [Pedococcus sp. 5OH_020]|uniref:ROK family protein n=1 Tax=Pedococcus sp. 5OH_020 TaxID=2989814 RepID=UPI0022E9AF89|nr:ROK family protein [Pedococcus sp. 5OH_020]
MEHPVVAAVDVGGTRVKAALVDRAGEEVVSLTRPTPPRLDAPGALVALLRTTVEDLRAAAASQGRGDTIAACGVVVPGLVDDLSGVAVWSANLHWRDVPVATPLSEALEVPVALGHDVRAGLLAEARFGAARGHRHVLFMPVGTGIAGAMMLDGHVVVADGRAGELGHVVVEPGGPLCGCGARGCLEAVASAAAVERRYAARAAVATLPAAGPSRLGADRIADLVRSEDPVATQVWDDTVTALARAVVMVVTLTGVELVLVGGGLAQCGELLLQPLRRKVEQDLTFQRRPEVERPLLGDRAGCLGAACLAWDLT